MSQIRIIVVEDESIVAKDIQHSLNRLGYDVVATASTGEKALQAVERHTPDIVLMDIMLKGKMSGIDAAREIREKWNIPVVYLTAYADENTLNKAKITEPYGYIIKPFKEIDIHTSIEMAIYKHKKEMEVTKERDLLYSLVEGQTKGGILFVKSNTRIVKLKSKDIYFVEALKDYVVINVPGKRYTIHSTMKDIQKKLPESEFIRVHRSYIVRVDKIATIEFPNLVLESIQKIIPIGGSYKDALNERINLL